MLKALILHICMLFSAILATQLTQPLNDVLGKEKWAESDSKEGKAVPSWTDMQHSSNKSKGGGSQGQTRVLPSLDMMMGQVRPSKAQGLGERIYSTEQPKQGPRTRTWAERVVGGKTWVWLLMALLPAVWFSCTISEPTLNTGKQSPGKGKPLQSRVTDKDFYSLVRAITAC